MQSAEPTLAALSNPVLRYFLATRPAFLTVTLFACLVGLGAAACDAIALSPVKAAATLLFALLAHAGINVLKDYYDELNGTDHKFGTPWLEGMPQSYLVAQLQAFASGARRNDSQAQMRNMARAMTPREIEEVAVFYARKASEGERRP